jgi:hypothetical protein
MQQNKFIKIFYRLSPAEKIALKKWMYSPAFNKQEALRRLFDYLCSLKPENDPKLLAAEQLFVQAFPDELFQLPKLRYLLSDLMQLFEMFLVYRHRQTKTFDFQTDLAEAYRDIQEEDLSRAALAKAELILEAEKLRDYEKEYRLKQLAYRFQEQKDRSDDCNLQALNDSFDLAYIAGKLKQACRILSYQGMFSRQYDTGLLNKLLEYLGDRPDIVKEPAIGLYFYYYKAATMPLDSAKYFDQFKKYLFDFQSLLALSEIRDLYILAINYSIKRLNTADRVFFLNETFELYKRALENDFLLEQGKISPFAFSNIVAVALGMNMDEWAEDFINQNASKLDEKWRKAQTDYNRSRLYFYRKEFNKAADLLVADDFEDLHLNLSAKVLLLKIYYHLAEFQLIEGLINRFKTFLSRKKVLNYHKENYKNILRFIQRLLDLNPFSEKDKKKLRSEIETVELLTERVWLLEQLDKK